MAADLDPARRGAPLPQVVGGDLPVQRRSFVHQPALDGVRAVAVVLVLLFHAGLTFVPAGYLGVSVFFTLSGYLITSLLVAEHQLTGRVDLGAFWSRRLRRLLPASMLCIGSIVVARQLGAFARVDGLRTDIVGAATQVFNWLRLAGSTSYGDLFGRAPSPLDHYWSLAIEEQFYWVWPLALWGLLAVARRAKWAITALVGGLTVVMSAVAVVIAAALGPDAAYWATPARLPEILVGATLACWLAGRRSPVRRTAWLAPVALATVVVLSCTWPSASGPAYAGAMPAFALLSAALILGLQSPGRVRTVLSTRLMVVVGRISYGVYLFHWPVFVVLRERGWNLATPWGLLVALAITGALATLSFRLVEQPVRVARWSFPVTARRAAVATVVALAATQLVAPARPFIQADDELLSAAGIAPADSLVPLAPPHTVAPSTASPPPVPTSSDAVRAGVVGDAPEAAEPPNSAETPTTTTTTVAVAVSPTTSLVTQLPLGPPPPRPVRIEVAGDSTAVYVGQGLAAWSLDHPEQAQVDVNWCPGCSFVLDAEITTFDLDGLLDDSRRTIGTALPQAVRTLQPDIVVLMVTVNDVADRQWSADEGPLTPFDPRYVQRMTAAYADLTMSLLSQGVAHVAWVVPPRPNHLWNEPAMNEMGRYPVQHQVIRDVVAMFDQRVSVVDLDAWLTATAHDDDPWWRSDGVHLTDDSGAALAELYLGPLLVQRAVAG